MPIAKDVYFIPDPFNKTKLRLGTIYENNGFNYNFSLEYTDEYLELKTDQKTLIYLASAILRETNWNNVEELPVSLGPQIILGEKEINMPTNLDDIQKEAKRVYGENHFIKFESDGLRGVTVSVGSKSTSIQVNQITCENWYPQKALDSTFAALKALPDGNKL